MKWGGFNYELISDTDIRMGKLNNFGIFLVPGSPDAGECYYAGLGEKGYDEILSFLPPEANILESAAALICQ